MPALPSLSDLKTYLGLTGTGDDTLLATCLVDALADMERDTSRTFASGSNVTTRYSTDGETSLVIHDRPFTDASRTVTLGGVTMTSETNIWFLPDRRDPNITATIQLRYYATGRNWYKSDPNWFDKNLDSPRYGSGTPNDLVISGIIGHPFPRTEVCAANKTRAAWLYWRAKSGASGFVQLPNGDEIDLSVEPGPYLRFVERWRIRTAVIGV